MFSGESSDNYESTAEKYATMGITGTAVLAFRDAPDQFRTYGLHEKSGKRIMDLGCGGGRSLSFLMNEFKDDPDAAFDGVDTSQAMIEQAKAHAPEGSYHLVNQQLLRQGLPQAIPVADDCYDLAFSSLVLFEIPTMRELVNTLKEVRRSLKPDGIFVASTGRTTLYEQDKDWISVSVDFDAHSLPFKNGDKIQVFIKEAQINVTDYYWTEEDYEKAYQLAGFEILDKFYAGGKPEDKIDWRSEATPGSEPFVFFVTRPAPTSNPTCQASGLEEETTRASHTPSPGSTSHQ